MQQMTRNCDYLNFCKTVTFCDVNIMCPGYGCKKMGGETHEEVETTKVVCKSIDTFTCYWEPPGNPTHSTLAHINLLILSELF